VRKKIEKKESTQVEKEETGVRIIAEIEKNENK